MSKRPCSTASSSSVATDASIASCQARILIARSCGNATLRSWACSGSSMLCRLASLPSTLRSTICVPSAEDRRAWSLAAALTSA